MEMTPSPWGRSPPLLSPGCIDTRNTDGAWLPPTPGSLPTQPGLSPPIAGHPPRAASFPALPVLPCADKARPHAPPPPPSPKYYTGPLPSSPPGTPCCSRWGAEERHTCAGLRAEVPRALHNAAEAGRGRRGSGIAAAAAPRSPYLMLMSLSGGDLLARGFYSAR